MRASRLFYKRANFFALFSNSMKYKEIVVEGFEVREIEAFSPEPVKENKPFRVAILNSVSPFATPLQVLQIAKELRKFLQLQKMEFKYQQAVTLKDLNVALEQTQYQCEFNNMVVENCLEDETCGYFVCEGGSSDILGAYEVNGRNVLVVQIE